MLISIGHFQNIPRIFYRCFLSYVFKLFLKKLNFSWFTFVSGYLKIKFGSIKKISVTLTRFWQKVLIVSYFYEREKQMCVEYLYIVYRSNRPAIGKTRARIQTQSKASLFPQKDFKFFKIIVIFWKYLPGYYQDIHGIS